MNLKRLRRKRLHKKGFEPGQIFVYSLSLVIVSMILIYGYTVITDFIGDSSQVEMLQFKKLMEGYVKSYSTEYGSTGTKKLVLPGNVEKVCFTDFNWQQDNLLDCLNPSSTQFNVIVDDSFTPRLTREKKNIFLFSPRGDFIESYYIGNVTLSGPDGSCSYLCLDSQRGGVTMRIQGRGDHAVITKP